MVGELESDWMREWVSEREREGGEMMRSLERGNKENAVGPTSLIKVPDDNDGVYEWSRWETFYCDFQFPIRDKQIAERVYEARRWKL